jgi:hypothetical protein
VEIGREFFDYFLLIVYTVEIRKDYHGTPAKRLMEWKSGQSGKTSFGPKLLSEMSLLTP